MPFAYEEQLGRAQRYYDRFQRVTNGIETSTPTAELVDDIHSFFIHCYHVADYLKNDPTYTKHSDQVIDDYVRKTRFMARFLTGDRTN